MWHCRPVSPSLILTSLSTNSKSQSKVPKDFSDRLLGFESYGFTFNARQGLWTWKACQFPLEFLIFDEHDDEFKGLSLSTASLVASKYSGH